MSLKALAKSLNRGEVLLPVIRQYLSKRYEKLLKGNGARKKVVIEDALMTIKCFKERIDEFNHGEISGEFFHPSRLGSCLRMLWLDHKGAPRDSAPTSEDLLREHLIFETGTYIGAMIQNLCEAAGVLVQREVPIVDKAQGILGHADGTLLIDKVDYVLEIKTINSRGMMNLVKPQDSHLRQTHAYMKSLGIMQGIILYIEKDRHTVKEFVVTFDEGFYKKYVKDRIATHFKNLKSAKPPEREGEDPKMYPCMFCAFKRVCFGTAELKKFLAAPVAKKSAVKIKFKKK
jgi:CRISPR/Cas system-associated exonuclease Cas4 (RecB family)